MPAPPPPAVVTLASCPVSYQILYKESAAISGSNANGYNASLMFLVAQNDVGTFVSWALGTPVSITLSGGTVVTRIIPLQHPVYTKLLCNAVDGKATGHWTSTNPTAFQNWSDAKVKLEFATVPFAVDGSAPMSVTRMEGGSEQHSMAGSKLTFLDGTPCSADASQLVPVQQYVTTVYNCTSLGDTAALGVYGNVNSATFLGLSAGSVLFENLDAEEVAAVGNYSTFQRSYKWKWRPIDWNKFLKPDGSWDYVYKPGTSTSAGWVYPQSDLNVLLV